jgi:hypothetical protein
MIQAVENLRVQIYAGRDGMIKLYRNPLIKSLMTNATLMRTAGFPL